MFSNVCVRLLLVSDVELVEDSSGRVDSRFSEMTSTEEGSDGSGGTSLLEVCVRLLLVSGVELVEDSSGRVDS